MALLPAPASHHYLAFLGRPGDDYGVMAGGADPVFQRPWMAASTEYAALAGQAGQAPAATLITLTYQRLFNRDPEAAGLAYWLGELHEGRLAAHELPLAILQGAQNADRDSVHHKLAAAAAFRQQMDTAFERTHFYGEASAAVARAFIAGVSSDPATLAAARANAGAAVAAAAAVSVAQVRVNLTPARDVVDGASNTAGDRVPGPNDDWFLAQARDLGQHDWIDGLAGDDLLEVGQEAGIVDTSPDTILNIERVHLYGPRELVDLAGVSDLRQVSWFAGAGGTLRGLASTVPVALSTDGGDIRVEFSDRLAPGEQAAHFAAVDSWGSNFGTLTVPDIEHVVLSLESGGFGAVLPQARVIDIDVALASHGRAASMHAIDAPAASLLAITGEGLLELGPVNLAAGALVTIAGALNAAVVLASGSTSVDASQASGSVRVDLRDLVPTGTLRGGAGAADILATLGAGTITAANRGNIQDFEYLEVRGNHQALDGQALPGTVLLVGESDSVTIVNADTLVIAGDQRGSITVDGPSDTVTLVLDRTGAATGETTVTVDNVIADGARTLRVESQGIARELYRYDNVIHSLAGLSTGEVDTIVFGGGSSLTATLGNVGRSLVIDGSWMRSDFTFRAHENAAAVDLRGGQFTDVLRGTAFADSLRGGTGNDVFEVFRADSHATSAAQLVANADSILDWGVGGDRLRYETAITPGSHATASAGLARIEQGFATFSPADASLVDKVNAVEAALRAGGAAGQAAAFLDGGHRYVFISNGVAGTNDGDVLVRLVGVTSSAGLTVSEGAIWGYTDM